jgi:L-aspartate oxidase
MEFIQFHPTCLYHPHTKSFLISAVRGEGGILEAAGWHPLHAGSRSACRTGTARRGARAIDFEMKKHGLDCVYLDISYKPANFIKEHFPNIYAHCLELGIDITQEPIPVVPAVHFTCGGLGQTSPAILMWRRCMRWVKWLAPPARCQPSGQQLLLSAW